MRSAPRRIVFAALSLMTVLQLAACNEAEERDPGRVVAVKGTETIPVWLSPKDKMEPAVWLRSREAGHEVLSSDPEVDRLRRALHQASIRFYEDTRMIANRTAQTSDMLGEAHQPERLVDIMTGMIDVADVTVHKKLYGEMCQHYLNIRKSGNNRSAAIVQLTDAYEKQRGMQ